MYFYCAYYHWSYEFNSSSWRGRLDTVLCGKVCPWLVTCHGCSCTVILWFLSTILIELTVMMLIRILLKVMLNTRNLTLHLKLPQSKVDRVYPHNQLERKKKDSKYLSCRKKTSHHVVMNYNNCLIILPFKHFKYQFFLARQCCLTRTY